MAERTDAVDRAGMLVFRGSTSIQPARPLIRVVRRQGQRMIAPQQLWDGLLRVRAVRFESRSSTPGWDGVGNGEVAVDSSSLSALVFTESGVWHPSQGRETRFSNVFRWTLGATESLKLEHLRFGPEHPVYLFDLLPDSDDRWASVKPHL